MLFTKIDILFGLSYHPLFRNLDMQNLETSSNSSDYLFEENSSVSSLLWHHNHCPYHNLTDLISALVILSQKFVRLLLAIVTVLDRFTKTIVFLFIKEILKIPWLLNIWHKCFLKTHIDHPFGEKYRSSEFIPLPLSSLWVIIQIFPSTILLFQISTRLTRWQSVSTSSSFRASRQIWVFTLFDRSTLHWFIESLSSLFRRLTFTKRPL